MLEKRREIKRGVKLKKKKYMKKGKNNFLKNCRAKIVRNLHASFSITYDMSGKNLPKIGPTKKSVGYSDRRTDGRTDKMSTYENSLQENTLKIEF